MSVHDFAIWGVAIVPDAKATIDATIRHWAAVQPEHPYLTWCPVDGDAEVLTYAELEWRSGQLAAWLAAQLTEGEKLGLIPGRDIPSVIAIIASLRAGVPCLLLSPDDPLPRLRAIVSEHQLAIILRSPFAGKEAKGLAVVIPDSGSPVSSADCPAIGTIPATRPALLFGTSGSTAASKIVVQSHQAMASNAEAVRRHHHLDPGTVILGGLPIHHVNGVHFTLIATLYAGAQVVLPQQVLSSGYRNLFDNHEPDLASLVPPLLEALLIRSPNWRPPASLRYFVSAAAPLTKSLVNRIVNAYGIRVIQGYGLSETTNFSTTVPVDASWRVYREVMLDSHIPSVGIALYGNDVEVLASDGTVLGERQQGEICMRGHNVMEGYAGRADLTAEAFAGGWFHSGDLGYSATAQDGRRYFYITGRSKNIAKIRGETVSLEEIERALLSTELVMDAACIAVPHPLSGEQIIAFVHSRGASIEQIRTQLARLLPANAIPSSWQEYDSIPRTVTGKLQRSLLARLANPPHGSSR